MGFRQFQPNTGFEVAVEDCIYTVEACMADKALSPFAKGLNAHVEQWDTLEGTRRVVRRRIVRANARVRYFDLKLDGVIGLLANEVLHAVNRNYEAPLYRRLFPDSPTAIIRLGLESECKEVDRILGIVSEAETPTAVKKVAAPLARLVAEGREALKEREEAMAEQGRVSARIATWKEGANKLRLGVYADLQKYAAENGLGRDFADAFFPSQKSGKKDSGEADGDGGDGGAGGQGSPGGN